METSTMTRRPTLAIIALLGAGPLNGLGVGPAAGADDPRPAQAAPGPADAASAPMERAPYDPRLARGNVDFWEKRVKADPDGVIGFRELAGAYLALQRETGDIAEAVHAERAARRALELIPRGNANGLRRLARSLLAQHRFPEALEAADHAAKLDVQAERLRVDILLELGAYDEAARALAKYPPSAAEPGDPNYLALQSRIAAIDGAPGRALKLMREAQAQADDQPDMPSEAVAWYHTMIGHALIDSGKLDEGEASCRKALGIFPRDYRAMTGLAEAATWRGDWAAAIDWGAKAIAIAPQNPEALKLIGEAHAARGETEAAEREFKRLETLAHSFPRIYDRHWALFCADHGRDLDQALALARKDLELRKDIHGHDALAWVAFKNGLQAEAEAAMKLALARGTEEAPLFHHAGVIARAGGDPDRAEGFFAKARALNPYLMKAAEPAAGR